MSRKKKKYIFTESSVVGRFRVNPDKLPRRIKLCDLEDYNYKITKRGRSKRSKTEKAHYLDFLYNEKEEYLLHEKIEEDRRKQFPLISEVMTRWIASRQSTKARLTVRESTDLKRYYLMVNDDHPLCDFSPENVSHLIDYFEGIGNAPYTVNKRLQELQTFLNWCYKLEYFDRPVKIDRVKVVAREPVILGHEDEAKLVKRIKALLKKNKSKRYKTTYRMQLRSYYMLAFTGMRRGELINLKLSNIDMKNDIIEIRGEHIKEGREKDIPIAPALKEYLLKDLDRRKKGEVWFLDNGRGDHYFKFADNLTAGFKKHLTKLGVKGIKPLHGFRATVASRLLNEENYDVSHVRDLLGHSDIKTTLGYKKKDLPKLREAVSSLSNGKKKKRKKKS